MDASRPLRIWVISDGRRGIENQALGLAEAIGRLRPVEIERFVLESGATFKKAPPKMQFTMRKDPAKYGLFGDMPDLAIGCGRQAIAALMAVKKKGGDKTFTTYIQDPRIEPEHFDLVIAPEHDDIRADNVVTMIGAPNRINNTELITSVLAFNDPLVSIPMPRVAMLIGGDSKTHTLSEAVHAKHLKAARDVLASGRGLLVTVSRRTPDWALRDYQDLAAGESDMWLYDGSGDNPYVAFLGGADTILVTEDSTNMLTDACTAGKSVLTLPMDGNPGKFQKLYDSLAERCNVKPYDSIFKTGEYVPLSETHRMAEIVLERMGSKLSA